MLQFKNGISAIEVQMFGDRLIKLDSDKFIGKLDVRKGKSCYQTVDHLHVEKGSTCICTRSSPVCNGTFIMADLKQPTAQACTANVDSSTVEDRPLSREHLKYKQPSLYDVKRKL